MAQTDQNLLALRHTSSPLFRVMPAEIQNPQHEPVSARGKRAAEQWRIIARQRYRIGTLDPKS
jgi:hypothetical protein